MAEINQLSFLIFILSVLTIAVLIRLSVFSPTHRRRTKSMKAEDMERRMEIFGDPSWSDEFRPMVEMARDRFPSYHVWGQYIHAGKGYGIFVSNGIKKSMFQVKSALKITTETGTIDVDNDIRKASNIADSLRQAFNAMEKSLNDNGGMVATGPR